MASKEKTSMARKHDNGNYQWRVMDIHIHTPASSDFQQPEVTYLDILQRAEARGVDILGFTDHNTLLGYRTMQEEIQGLELLERLNRLMPNEETRLKEYRRLLGKLLILPGFEFTATFGFHILALCSPPRRALRAPGRTAGSRRGRRARRNGRLPGAGSVRSPSDPRP